jgi:phage head maturation protease
MSKFQEAKTKLEAGELTLDDLRSLNIDPDDFRKMRVGEGITHRRAMKDKPEAQGDRTYRYVMSTENAVGFFRDVVKVSGWELEDFKKRQQPFLFGHNVAENRPPLGRMNKVKKDQMPYGRVLAGDAEFTPEGISEFNDMIHDMVEAGFMPGGSVGFNVLQARKPTEREMKSIANVNEFSSIIERAQLVEFSAVPVGMDPDAVKMRAADADGVEAFLREAIEAGRYDRELVAEFRHEYLGQQVEARQFWSGFRAEPGELKVGDHVSWNSSGGRAYGDVERIERDGVVDVPDTDFKITGTEDDPAALIRLHDEDHEPTDTLVGHKFSTLRKEDAKSERSEAGDQGESASTSVEVERLVDAIERLELINAHLEKRIAQLEGLSLSQGEEDTGIVARNEQPDLFDLYLEAF